jgi:isopentenyl diphosphate isomerase/L-lactate dehydrogenase-like FMN-dependent dehydrogenase
VILVEKQEYSKLIILSIAGHVLLFLLQRMEKLSFYHSEIAAAASGPLWFQMYTYRGLDIPAQMVRRAEAAGYRVIVVTVDAPQLGKRERDIRNNFKNHS